MLPYGIPRVKDIENPDLADVKNFGLKSSISRIRHYGEIKNSFRNSRIKKQTRRIWKRIARRFNKSLCDKNLE